MEELSTTQKTSIEALINKGYQNAASSFSSLIAQNVTISYNDIKVANESSTINDLVEAKKETIIVKTNIIGDLVGESFLLLSPDEEETICKLSLNAFGGGAGVDNDLILKEIDNIISAAVITELSNALDLKIYGDVPHLYHLGNKEGFNDLLKLTDDEYYILTDAHFVFDGHISVCPKFIWKFEEKLASLIG